MPAPSPRAHRSTCSWSGPVERWPGRVAGSWAAATGAARWSCAARATTAATAWSRRVCCAAGGCASTPWSSPRPSSAPRSHARSTRADLVIDAMYGTGFHGALDGDAAWLVGRDRLEPGAVVLAVDIPSGVDGATGAVLGRGGGRRRDGHVRGTQARRGVRARAQRSPARWRSSTSGSRSTTTSSARWSLDRVDVLELVPPRRGRRAQVGGGGDGRRGLGRHDRCAACWPATLRCAPGRAWSCAGCPATMPRAAPPAARSSPVRCPPLDDGALAVDAVDAVLDGARAVPGARARARGSAVTRTRSVRCATCSRTPTCPVVLDADGLNALDGRIHLLANRAEARWRSRSSRPTTASTERLAGDAGRRRPGRRCPRPRRAVAGRRAPQGPDDRRRRARRRTRVPQPDRHRRFSRPPGPATSSPVWSRRSWPGRGARRRGRGCRMGARTRGPAGRGVDGQRWRGGARGR